MSNMVTCGHCKRQVPAEEAIISQLQSYGTGAVIEQKILCKDCKKRINRASWIFIVLALVYLPLVIIFVPEEINENAGAFMGILLGGYFVLFVIFKIMSRPQK